MANKNKKSKPYKIIGMTGGIASGKSTASSYLKTKGFAVLCADEIVHDLLKNKSVLSKIRKTFGNDVFDSHNQIDRKKLGTLVFDDFNLRKKLEMILHPLVKKELKNQIQNLITKGQKIIFLDIPLLFESGFNKLCDETWCIYTTQKNQIERLQKRNQLKKAEALKRIRAQMPLKDKKRYADYVIDNTGSKSDLRKSIQKVLSFSF